MGCVRVDLPGGGIAIACSRGRGERSEPCGTPKCGGTSVALCDWPLTGPKAGKTCDRRMCETCRTKVGPDKDHCRVHAAMVPTTDSLPVAIVGAREFQALHLVASHVLTLPPKARVVSGHAKGVDIVAEIAALQRGLETTIFPARGDTKAEFTKAAFARNTKIADAAREANAFVTKTCRGTWDTVQKLRGMGKMVRIHEEPPPAEHVLYFHTAIHPNTNQAPRGYRGPSMLDITRGSGGPEGLPFAPSDALRRDTERSLVHVKTLLERGEKDAAAELRAEIFLWFEPIYTEEMRVSWKQCRPAWDAALAKSHFVAACHCPDRQCHRWIFARLLVKAGEKVGRCVIDGGEVPC